MLIAASKLQLGQKDRARLHHDAIRGFQIGFAAQDVAVVLQSNVDGIRQRKRLANPVRRIRAEVGRRVGADLGACGESC